ncbi:MAG: PQQ-dependent sugar dehydrogenase [Anaerolineales bacterium]
MALLAAGFFIWRISQQVNLAGFRTVDQPALIELPPNFTIQRFAEDLNGPRFITFSPDGVLYVAERGADRILRLPDHDSDGRADVSEIFATDLNDPHSLIYHEGSWYVGVPTGVVRLTDTDSDGHADERQVLIDDYPTGGHNTRTVLFMPDGRMVVSIGSSCNACEEQDPRRAAIVSYEGPSGQSERIYARGLRNAVGLALHPETGQLWATNNGRDFLGDNRPPDTLIAVEEGEDYGWPRCHSGRIVDPEYGRAGDCQDVPEPAMEIQAHSAPLGLVFYTGDMFPEEYRGDLFIAYHGSWNRSIPTGYKVVRVPFDDGLPSSEPEDFASGWLGPEKERITGRPVGLAVGPEGALYLSDDSCGVIYRIIYQPSSP